jgi:hypothetical protein
LYRTIFDPFASSSFRRISYVGFWIWYFASSVYQEVLSVFESLYVWPSFHQQGSCIAFRFIRILSNFLQMLLDSVFGITCLSQNFVCLRTRLCFGPLSHQQGTCIEFRSIRAWSDFLQMLLDLIFCIICLAFRSVFESRLFFALFPATRDLHCILIHFHLARFLTDPCGFEIASSLYQGFLSLFESLLFWPFFQQQGTFIYIRSIRT